MWILLGAMGGACRSEPSDVATLRPWWTEKDYPGQRVIEDLIFEATNRERSKQRLPLLWPDPALRVAARQHSQEMLDLGYFQHESPREAWAKPYDRAYRAGFWEAFTAENIGQNYSTRQRTAQEVADEFITGWMNSPPHRKNILSPDYTCLGVGVVEKDGRYVGTQMFGFRHYDVQKATLRQAQERMVRVVFEVETKAQAVNVAINQVHYRTFPVEQNRSRLVLEWPKSSGKYTLWLATDGTVRYVADLDTYQPVSRALVGQPVSGEGLTLRDAQVQEVDVTNYLLEARVRVLSDAKQFRLFVDDAMIARPTPDQKRTLEFTARLRKDTGQHQVGLFPDEWRKYQFFVDTDQPVEKAFIPRFSPY